MVVNNQDTASDIGVSEKDVGVVANQAKVSREKAIETLKKHNGDIVGALMVCNLVFDHLFVLWEGDLFHQSLLVLLLLLLLFIRIQITGDVFR